MCYNTRMKRTILTLSAVACAVASTHGNAARVAAVETWRATELAYAARCPEVRVRQAWKPVPSPVPDQVVQNEPVAEGVFRTTYSNGESTLANYGDAAVTVDGVTVPPLSYRICTLASNAK